MSEIDKDILKSLVKGLQVMTTFTCEHERWGPIAKANSNRCVRTDVGGTCNSCWAKGFAEDFLKVLGEKPWLPGS